MTHPPGTFSFSELHTPAFDLSKRFYGDLFGWTAVDVAPGYAVFRLDGHDIVALRETGEPHRWVPQVAVANVEEVASRGRELGARIAVAPADTPGIARTCVVEDPEGAVFGLWEPQGHRGAHLQDAIGTMWWVELLARDVGAARAFYTSLFGWTFGPPTTQYGPIPYTIFKVGDVSAAGAIQFEPDWGISARWQVWISVADWKATMKRMKALGGENEFWRDVPTVGRGGTLHDPGEAVFAIMQVGYPPAVHGEDEDEWESA